MMDLGLYAAMLYTTPAGTVMPGLVTAFRRVANGGISTDLKTWKFTFRSGLKWSDGQTLDARDMDFTWKLWANPKFGAINTIAVQDITSADISSDNLTITFHLKTGLVSFYTYFTDGYYGAAARAPLCQHGPGRDLEVPGQPEPLRGQRPLHDV